MSESGERPGDHEAIEAIAASPRRRLLLDLTPLREHREFRILWLGKGVSYFGSQITRIAIPFQVYGLTRSSLAVGLVGLCELVPIVGLSLVGGALADSLDRRKVLIRTDVALALLSLVLAANAVLARPSLALIYVVAVFSSAAYTLGRPALDAAIPRLVPVDQMPAASALAGVQGTAGFIVGPMVGGVMIAALGLPSAYALDVVTFVAAIVAGLLLQPIIPTGEATGVSLRAIGEGLAYLRSEPTLIGTYLVDVVAMVFGMPEALFPALAVERFGGNAGVFGLLVAAPAIGSLLISLVSGWTGRIRRHGLAIVWGAAGWGLAIAVFGLVHWLPLALVLLAVAGAADMVSGIFRMTMWNQLVPDHLRGRLAGVEMASYAGGPALGNLESGAVASVAGLQVAVVSGGVLCLAGVAVAAVALPGFRRYRAVAHGEWTEPSGS